MSRGQGTGGTGSERARRLARRRRLRNRILQILAILAALGLVASTIYGTPAGAVEAGTAHAGTRTGPTSATGAQAPHVHAAAAQTDDDLPEPGPGQWFMEPYDIPELWKETRGEGVTVAVIDSGVSDEHENLTDRVTASRDFSGAGKDGTEPVGADSIIHHGTAVAGVIAGTGEGSGPVGVAPEARIASASVWLGGGAPAAAQSTRVQAEQALRWAVDSGASVVNMSLGWDDPSWPQAWDDAFAYAYEKDAVVIACVGNRSQGATQAWSPATVPGVVGVGGLTQTGEVRQTSSAPGTAVDLMGPAEDIPVPYWDGGYGTADGCSFAAPVVAGIAALLRSAHPDWSADQVVAALTETAGPVAGHEGQGTAEEPDPLVGYGRVDPAAALAWEARDDVPSASDQLSDWVAMHRRAEAPDDAAHPGDEAAAEDDSGGAVLPDGSVTAEGAAAPLLGPVVLVIGGLVGAALLGTAVVTGVRGRRGGPGDGSADDGGPATGGTGDGGPATGGTGGDGGAGDGADGGDEARDGDAVDDDAESLRNVVNPTPETG